jgi:hypothetical protein
MRRERVNYSVRLACHHIERECGGDQRVVLFDKVHRVSEAAVARLWWELDTKIRQDSRDRVRVVEAESRSPRLDKLRASLPALSFGHNRTALPKNYRTITPSL